MVNIKGSNIDSNRGMNENLAASIEEVIDYVLSYPLSSIQGALVRS